MYYHIYCPIIQCFRDCWKFFLSSTLKKKKKFKCSYLGIEIRQDHSNSKIKNFIGLEKQKNNNPQKQSTNKVPIKQTWYIMFSHSSLLYSLQNYLFINNNNPFSFGGKKPSKTQINQKAIFQYVKFFTFLQLIKNKIPINQLQTKMHVPACICSLFAHYLSLSTFNITLQPFEANRDKSTCKAECICLYS